VEVDGESSRGHTPDQLVPPPSEPSERRFRTLYETQYSDIYRFALRRLDRSREDAADVTAEVFATAWRRLDQIPPPPEDRLWLFGVARRVLSRHQRSVFRRSRLVGRLSAEAAVSPDTAGVAEDGSMDRIRVQAAIGRLRRSDRDVLSLVLWEGLSHAEASRVLQCSVNAVALRLYKARERLRLELLRDRNDPQVGPKGRNRLPQQKEPRHES
jgi:RNA polymerase sigma factor (sigma-70 family)